VDEVPERDGVDLRDVIGDDDHTARARNLFPTVPPTLDQHEQRWDQDDLREAEPRPLSVTGHLISVAGAPAARECGLR
jgi:hypothetical protein